jgi:hypothetical protein|tara:strand:- start:1467 stop:1727 length:261 start_codon:yes stop_codon:yes gene_type:complete
MSYSDPHEQEWSKTKLENVDLVNQPPHYTKGKIEVIDFIEDQKFGYHLGNAIKYICRSFYKGKEIEDLEKAMWYIKRRIKLLKEAK